MKSWLKKYKKSIIVILCCLLAIGGVITGAVLGRNHNNTNTIPPTISDNEDNESATPPTTDTDEPAEEEPVEKVYTLMDLGSTGCVPCDNLQPVLASLRTQYEGKINVLFYDVNRTTEGRKLANQYRVQYIPTLIFLDEYGKEVKRIVGYQSETQLKNAFRTLGWIS